MLMHLCLCIDTIAQSNCNLINSITLNVPDSVYSVLGPVLGCVNNYDPPSNAATEVHEPFPSDTWSLITLTKSGNNDCNFYVNGVLVFTGNYANLPYFWNTLIMGAGLGTNYYGFFKGYIDEVRLSNIERNSSEVYLNFQSNAPFTWDMSTIGLWHFDQTSGSTVDANVGATGTINNATWSDGYFDNCLYLNGINSYVTFNMAVPTEAFTIEAWVKPEGLQGGVLFTPYGIYNADFGVFPYEEVIEYNWSNGDTGNSITINPIDMPYVWVTDGNCTDTVWFNSETAEVFDTTFITVTDTLIINLNPTGFNPVTYANTILMYPNPTSEELTINYGDFASLAGYTLKIFNSIGQEIHSANINQQQEVLPLDQWGGAGTYQVVIYNAQGVPVDTRAIVLQD